MLFLATNTVLFSYQAGLRAELSDISTEIIGADPNDRQYANLFPSGHVTYEFNETNSLQLSYSRRIWRPRFRSLNPFFSYSDSRNFRSGNPDLDPEFTDSYELSHAKYWKKVTLTSSIYYRHTTGVVERVRTINDDGSTISQPYNLSTEDAYGAEFAFTANIAKWWRLDGDLNFFRSIIQGTFEGQSLDADALSFFGRASSRWTIKKDVNIQARFNYRAPRQTPQGSRLALYYLNIGVNKDIFKKKGTLTLSVSDVFNTRKWRYTTEGFDFFNEGDFQWRSRQITLTLNYRLNQKKQRSRDRGGRDFNGSDDMGF